MKSCRIILFLLIVHYAMTGLSFGESLDQSRELYEQIKNVQIDENKVAEVEGLVIKRDAAIFRLIEGKICLFEPVGGRIIGAVFSGEGVFEFSPPTEIERYQLKRFAEQESLAVEFNELYLAFSDTTDLELARSLYFSTGQVSRGLKSTANNSPERFLKETAGNLWTRVLADILADSSYLASHPDRGSGFFYADVKTKELGPLFFTFDPKEVEEVVLQKLYSKPGMEGRDLVCSFHRAEDYSKDLPDENTPIAHEDKDEIKVTHYKMEVSITIMERLSANVEMDFESLVDGVRVIDFNLNEKLEIERVTDEQGDSLYFVKEKDEQYGVSVFLPSATKAGETRKLTFKYSAKEIIAQDWLGDLYVRSSTFWYPRYGYRKRATYDLTFKCPKGYQLISIGEKTKEWIEGDSLCTRWVQEIPVSVASFNYGKFETYEMELEGIPAVCVYHLEKSHRKMMTRYKKSKESVAADVVNSLNFFQTIYGDCPFPRIAATEIPSFYGQGLPGLLRLSWGTFAADEQFQETRFRTESFRAHEVSHQWWGHVVGWETYHDQWLSEGFAEYSGAWFAQMSMQDNEEFFDELEKWRKDILGEGFKWAEGSKVGPIWLGHRLNSSKSGDYGTLVYEKGAYVLHMLRNMMMDYDNKSDDRFKEMMGDFAQTFRGTDASTEDFKAIVEKHLEEDMDWFFDQWIYGVEIPTYLFSYTTQKIADKYVVSCEVTQENVPEGFKMWVPVLLDFGGDMYAVLRLWVDKPHNKYELPKAPLEPQRVILNPFHAVLCEVKGK